MNKKVISAVLFLGMGMGTAFSAFGWDRECNRACSNAEYYCNYLIDNAQCDRWVDECLRCSGGIWV